MVESVALITTFLLPLTFTPSTKSWFTVDVNRPGFPGECFICELRLPDHRFRWK
ncbi:major capsid protein, partial [Escherichia coli]